MSPPEPAAVAAGPEYVTEVWCPGPATGAIGGYVRMPDPEPVPEVLAEADAEGPRRPALADCEAATAATATAIADPSATPADVQAAAEAERAAYLACPDWPSPEADAEVEAGL